MKYGMKQFTSAVLGLSLCLGISFGCHAESSENSAFKTVTESKITADADSDYSKYTEIFSKYNNASSSIEVPAASFIKDENAKVHIGDYDGVKNALLWDSMQGSVIYEINVPDTALYEIDICYEAISGKDSQIDIGLKIDGAYPFSEAASNKFCRVWKDNSGILTDENGNDYTPSISETFLWQTSPFCDTDGYHGNKPFRFLLTAGVHKLTLVCNNEAFALQKIILHGTKEIKSYSETAEEYKSNGALEYGGEIKYIQAETPYRKSEQTLRAQYDRNSPLMQPYDASHIRCNYIGGTSWRYQSQWISWEIDVPQDGLYQLGARYLQDTVKGFSSSRRLYIDGCLPFAEAECISFDYTEDWDLNLFGDGDTSYLFYLTKGRHILKLEVVMGDVSQIVSGLQSTAEKLMALYRRIIMVTGTSPDAYRDYNIATVLPEMVTELKDAARVLKAEKSNLEVLFKSRSINVTAMQTLLTQIEKIIEDPESIVSASRLGSFSSNISSLSSWLLDLKYQPLAIDYFILKSPSGEAPKVKPGFFKLLYSGLVSFLSSFVNSYNSATVSGSAEESITVWVLNGREQMQTLKSMIADMFTPESGVNVNIKLVNASLIQAILSNDGPDVALMVSRANPVNLAVRNAAVDLSKLDGFEELKSDFIDSAFEPYKFNGGCYAIPDSLEYHMMFYRTDIFAEMGIKVPETWDDILDIAPILQRNNMRIGLPYPSADASGAVSGIGTRTVLPTLLLQSGVDIYTKDLKKTNLSSEKAFSAFNRWTQFYTLYNFSQSYSFYNLFRTGEMPIGIASYNTYNTIKVAAPEIDGLWEMTLIPGTIDEDGKLCRTEAANGTASLIFANTDKLDESWKFIKWWTSAEAQTRYAKDMEAVLGLSGRQMPANIKTLASLSWTNSQYNALTAQMNQIRDIPEAVGGYYTIRNIENAFTDTVINNKNARESLAKWSKETDAELERKRHEFGIGD